MVQLIIFTLTLVQINMSELLEINLDKEFDKIPQKTSKSKSYQKHKKQLINRCNKCYICGCEDINLTIDHIKPKLLGGRHGIGNLGLICDSCNEYKSKKEAIISDGINVCKQWETAFDLGKKKNVVRRMHSFRKNIKNINLVISILPII